MYRSGVGARGPIKPGATPSASERPTGFDKVVAGRHRLAAAPSPKTATRRARRPRARCRASAAWSASATTRPRRSPIPGVVTAAAAWDLHDGVPAVILRVLLEAGREAEFADVRATHRARAALPRPGPLSADRASRRCCATPSSTSATRAIRATRSDDVEAACAPRSASPATRPTNAPACSACARGASASASTPAASRAGCRTSPACCGARSSALGRFAAGVTDPATLALAGRAASARGDAALRGARAAAARAARISR